MPLELALVQPPAMYDVAPPSTYQEAGQLLHSAGKIVHDTVEQQPKQETYAQILTAQMLKDLSGGWMDVFSIAASDPADPQAGEVRFRWQPGGTLSVVMPDHASPEFCSGVEGLYRGATWREVMEAGDGMRLSGLSGEFDWRYQGHLDEGAGEGMGDAIAMATVDLYGMLFRFEDDGSPLVQDIEINWGAADECLKSLAASYRNNKG